MSDFDIELALQQAGITNEQEPQGAAVGAAAPTSDSQAEAVFDGEDVSGYLAEAQAAPTEAGYVEAEQPQQPALSPDTARLLQQNQELLQQTFAAQTQQQRDTIAALEARLAAYEQTTAQPQETEKPWYEGIELPELTEEQKAQYAASMPVIEAIARQQALEIAKRMHTGYVEPAMREWQNRVQPLQEAVNVTAAQAEAQRANEMQRTIYSKLPWLETERSGAAYNEYFNAVVPGTGGLSRKVLVEQAYKAGNADAVIDLLSGFKPQAKQTSAEYVAPGRNNTATPTSATAAPPRKGMKLSTYSKALEAFSNGTISAAKFAEYETAWNSAIAAGTAVVDE